MKVAIVHDALLDFGGAERVLQVLLKVYPHADIYSAFVDKKMLHNFFSIFTASHIYTSWAQNTPVIAYGSLAQCLSPLIWRNFSFDQYDMVLSSSAYLCSNIIRVRKPYYIQYIHSLPKNVFGLEPPSPLQRVLPYAGLLRLLYIRALQSTPYILTNSKHTHDTLLRICDIESTVIYPPVCIPSRIPKKQKGKYFLCVTRIDKTKGLELPIIACSQLDLPLKVVGTTNDSDYMSHLRSIAGPSVEFLGFVPDDELPVLYSEAKAFIFPSKDEDFGIAPLEAMSYGVPVIAYASGGVKETIISGITGLFFNPYSVRGLVQTLRAFQSYRFDSDILYRHAYRFRIERFINEIRTYVSSITKKDDVS